MLSSGDNWIRIFDIPDTTKHKKGFTIYKTISMLYPETCPDAVTKVTVWKRFNDFKTLHREIKVLHNRLNIRDKYPSLPKSSYFKRFDDNTVQERRQGILNFLEYVGFHSSLFTSNAFVKFFETSHTPVDQLNSNINWIRANLNLPEETEYSVQDSDDEQTASDTDSVTTVYSLGSSTQNNDFVHDSAPRKLTKSRLSLNTSIANSQYSKNSDSVSVSTTIDSLTLMDCQIYTPPSTPGCPDNVVQYVVDASVHVKIAEELENEKKYDEAFAAYKTAIDIFLKFGKDDNNYERRQMVRYKTEKCLIRAEKLYNMYLDVEIQNVKQITKTEEVLAQDCGTIPPISELYKFKVVKVIASGMLVLHAERQELFYIKVINKTMKFLNNKLVLPENVPYMVKLYNYYNCENALFLVLEYCSGKEIWEYIKYCSENPDHVFSMNDQILKQVQDLDLSDPDSEHSYSDLINDYAISKIKLSTRSEIEDERVSSDDSYEKVDVEELTSSRRNIMDDPIPSNLSISDLLSKSSQVNDQLNDKTSHMQLPRSQRKFSEMSSFDDVDLPQNMAIPMENIVKWSAQLLLALEKLHALGVICCNLQSHNLLINEEGDLILTYKCNIDEVCDVLSSEGPTNVAPELYSFEPVTSSVDWWCFGAILYELLVGLPLSSLHPDGLSGSTNLKIPKFVSPEGRSLLRQLLEVQPRQRLGSGANGTEHLKSHPFFHSVSWEQLLAKYNY